MEFNSDKEIDNPTIWKEKGKEFSEKFDYENAIKCYSHAIELSQYDLDAWNGLGNAYLKAGKIDDAKKVSHTIEDIKRDHYKIPQRKSDLNVKYKEKRGYKTHLAHYTIIAILMLAVLYVIIAALTGLYPFNFNINHQSGISESGITQYPTSILSTSTPVQSTTQSSWSGSSSVQYKRTTAIQTTEAPSLSSTKNVGVIVKKTADTGCEITWLGGSDISSITYWEIAIPHCPQFADCDNREILISDTKTPVVGQVNVYKGSSIEGQLIGIKATFTDGAKQVLYQRQY